jgi:hypothetical protein
MAPRMQDGSDRARLTALIAATEDAQGQHLAAVLRDHCWPDGGADRTEPAARAWLRRWHVERLAAAVRSCTCRRGRCAVCN